MENTNDETNLIDKHKEHIKEDSEEDEMFEDVNKDTISEEG